MIRGLRRLAIGAVAAGTATILAAAEPRLADEHIVLHTLGGDIVLGLFADVAPGHVAHVLQLARLGAYDSTHVLRLDPQGYYIQFSDANDRAKPLTAAQRPVAEQKLRAEFGGLQHTRGGLSMAHERGRPDSGGSSFSIITRHAPHLDPPNETYTVFGRVVYGMDVVDHLATLRRPNSDQPITRLTVLKARIVTAAEFAAGKWRGPHPIAIANAASGQNATDVRGTRELQTLAVGGFVAVALCASFAFFYARKIPGSRLAVSFSLLALLTAAFMLVVLLVPLSSGLPWLGFALLATLLVVIKMMTLFDSET
jgi:peptidyl-prolyl cis-trans isomerase B (cyclophilin B)